MTTLIICITAFLLLICIALVPLFVAAQDLQNLENEEDW